MAQAPDLSYAIGLKPEAAIEYFNSLGHRVSRDAIHTYEAARARAFTVTGVAKLDLVQDIKAGLSNALKSGTTLKTFQDDIESLIARRGWQRAGDRAVADLEGEVVAKDLSAHRLQTIFRTNMQSAYMAGKYKQLVADAEFAPYWQYVAVMDNRTRPSHRAAHSMVFRHDDPFWSSHFPPCDYNCRCTVRGLRGRDLTRLNLTPADSTGMLEPVMQPVGTRLKPTVAFTNPATKERYIPRIGFGQRPVFSKQHPGLGRTIGNKLESADPKLAAAVSSSSPAMRTGLTAEYQAWAKTVLESGRCQNDYRVVSQVSAQVQDRLEKMNIALASSAITMRDVELLHMSRDSKKARGANIQPASIEQLPTLMSEPVAVLLDTQDHALIYVISQGQDSADKVIVRVNWTSKVNTAQGRDAIVSNSVRTAGVVKVGDLKVARYRLLQGKLD